MTQDIKQRTLIDNIWITSKSRMIAEKRLRSYNVAAHLLTSYFSFLLIVASIFSSELQAALPYADKLNIALAVLVFALTLILYGFRFSESADRHRACYLKLQGLYIAPIPTDLSLRYNDILTEYPNHASRDYDDLIVERAIYHGRSVTEPGSDRAITPTYLMIIMYFLRRILFIFSSYLLPVAIPLIWIHQL